MPFFSISTFCYNSSTTLERTYESLLKQTLTDFEWILIDDCSSDDGKTKALMNDIQSKAPFPVKTYFFEEYYFGSKSFLMGCTLAEGEYIVNLDHDDQFLPETLSIAKNYIDKYCKRKNIAGICGRCIDMNGKMMGKIFVKNCFEEHMGRVVFKMGSPELIHFSKREIVKETARLMKPGYTSGFIWAELSKKYNYIYTNEVLRIYDTQLETSYTNNPKYFLKYPQYQAEALKHFLICYRSYLKDNLALSLRKYLSYIRFAFVEKFTLNYILKDFSFFMKVIILGLLPLGFILHQSSRYTFDERKRG